MIGPTWLRGLALHRPARLLGTALGVAVGVALLAAIGTFLSATTSRMTQRAVTQVPVDWQVEAQAGADPRAVLAAVRGRPGVERALPVAFARTRGFGATTGGATQQTGPGRVLGLPDGYAQAFPGQIRVLAGRGSGTLLYQQTAANLHARPGDVVTVDLGGGHRGRLRVDGVVDLPAIDSLFQQVGAPAGAQPQAPPDNVVLLPRRAFDALTRGGPVVTTQVHARVSHRLPSSPNSAYAQVTADARNLEVRLAGAGLVGDNLATTLDSARQDALYAQLLFLFLGLPGAVLAGVLTASIAAAGADRRRQEAGLLRTRGASRRQLAALALLETAVAGAIGIAVGLGAALLIGHATFGTGGFGASTASSVIWAVGAALAGLAIAAGAIALPAWRGARTATVAAQRAEVGRRDRAPWWARAGLDLIALAAAAVVFWQASRNGYSLVLVPEGIPQVSVNWYAMLAPVLAWIGGGLLAFRLADLVLRRGRRSLQTALRPVAGELAPIVGATMSRQPRVLATAVTLVALAGAFAGSTAIFNATYNAQAEADARLTNGADVTVTESPGVRRGPAEAARLGGVPGVASVEPLQHRYAYVGADLQDLYGVRPRTIGAAGKLQNGWFSGGSAGQLMRALAARPDGVLVSAETVRDFQLQPGDRINLRLQNGVTNAYRTIPFHFAGVVKEFPTAPRDSFLVANAGYVARRTGTDAVGAFLVQTDGTSPSVVARRLGAVTGTGARVTNIEAQRRIVGSNLTAVELSGLTKIELAFALVLALAASGLSLALGFQERRHTFALARAIGARPRQLGGFVWGESLFVTVAGLVLGVALAAAIAWMLVKVLTGVFDPPPDVLAVPWGYLAALVALTVAGVAAAGALTLRGLRREDVGALRDR
jgi:putative ABC transport system permease protein